MQSNQDEKLCTSVFKDGSAVTTKDKLTQKWIEIVNRLEKNKLAKTL